MIWARVRRLVPPGYEEEIKAKIAAGADLFPLMQECQQRFGAGEG